MSIDYPYIDTQSTESMRLSLWEGRSPLSDSVSPKECVSTMLGLGLGLGGLGNLTTISHNVSSPMIVMFVVKDFINLNLY